MAVNQTRLRWAGQRVIVPAGQGESQSFDGDSLIAAAMQGSPVSDCTEVEKAAFSVLNGESNTRPSFEPVSNSGAWCGTKRPACAESVDTPGNSAFGRVWKRARPQAAPGQSANSCHPRQRVFRQKATGSYDVSSSSQGYKVDMEGEMLHESQDNISQSAPGESWRPFQRFVKQIANKIVTPESKSLAACSNNITKGSYGSNGIAVLSDGSFSVDKKIAEDNSNVSNCQNDKVPLCRLGRYNVFANYIMANQNLYDAFMDAENLGSFVDYSGNTGVLNGAIALDEFSSSDLQLDYISGAPIKREPCPYDFNRFAA